MQEIEKDKIRKAVRDEYGKIGAADGVGTGCCTSSCGSSGPRESSRRLGYSEAEVSDVPEGADLGLGCGNPQTIASLRPGETVLDLGSGGGFDCFLAARQVGKTGHVIGVDMTSEMVTRARENGVKAGTKNVEFRLGEIEHLPAADRSVDVIMSNCVINLSPDKAAVYREAFRVLKPRGRLAISDIVATVKLPEEVRNDMQAYTGCVAGAAEIGALEAIMADAGFEEIRILPNDDSREILRNWKRGSKLEDYVASATVEARRPE